MVQTWLRHTHALRHYKEFGTGTFTAKLSQVAAPGVEGRGCTELTPAS